jgi:surfeit locus 1 family protein
MTESKARSWPLGLSVAVGLSLILLVSLGTWQLLRLQWKSGLLAQLEKSQSQQAVPLQSLDRSEGKLDWRSVRFGPCEIKPSQLIYMHGIVDGVAGYHIMTPCPVGASYITVELGFSPDKISPLKPVSIELEGRLRAYDKPNAFVPSNNPKASDWYWRQAESLATVWNLPLRSDYFVIVKVSPALKAKFSGLVQSPITATLSNRHLEYALTWFGLAATLLAVFLAYVRGYSPRP